MLLIGTEDGPKPVPYAGGEALPLPSTGVDGDVTEEGTGLAFVVPTKGEVYGMVTKLTELLLAPAAADVGEYG